MANSNNLTFSQRNGFEDLPSQLKRGEVPKKTRYQIANKLFQIIDNNVVDSTYGEWLNDSILQLFKHLWIEVFEQKPSEFSEDADRWKIIFENHCEKTEANELFDLLEILCRWTIFSELKPFLEKLLKSHFSAYSFTNGIFLEIGNQQLTDAYADALNNAESSGRIASKAHLENSAKFLRKGQWANSIRESIHSVEALIGKMAIKSNTLGGALSEIEKLGHLHPALKKGFSSLYGYTSNENGIRHALIEGENPKVGQAEALYMLGSCASFVSYILAQNIPET